MGELIDLAGQRFGRLVVVSRAPNGDDTRARWLCRCDCGGEVVTIGRSLRRGECLSCGCYRQEVTAARATKHGHSAGGKRSPTHDTWHAMLSRCQCPTAKNWPEYGGRGIRVCERWQVFENFLADMGERPEGLTLERRDVNGPYSPENCYWADRKRQARNRRNTPMLTVGGVTRCLSDWAEVTGLHRTTIRSRLLKGATHEEAIAPITRYSVPIVRRWFRKPPDC